LSSARVHPFLEEALKIEALRVKRSLTGHVSFLFSPLKQFLNNVGETKGLSMRVMKPYVN
jgi:hypothetical protein